VCDSSGTGSGSWVTVVPVAVSGNEFVWHCHTLEHEEHDMMRPLVVRGNNPRLI